MGFEKKIRDVVFINDIDLGISEYRKPSDRPCIIVDFDGEYYYVIHMTTQSGDEGDPNRDQLQLRNGSYVKLNTTLKKFSYSFIYNFDSPSDASSYKYELTDYEFYKICKAYIK